MTAEQVACVFGDRTAVPKIVPMTTRHASSSQSDQLHINLNSSASSARIRCSLSSPRSIKVSFGHDRAQLYELHDRDLTSRSQLARWSYKGFRSPTLQGVSRASPLLPIAMPIKRSVVHIPPYITPHLHTSLPPTPHTCAHTHTKSNPKLTANQAENTNP
jgi:hypothetical protein